MNKGDSDKAQGPEKQTGSKGEMAGVAVCSVNSIFLCPLGYLTDTRGAPSENRNLSIC